VDPLTVTGLGACGGVIVSLAAFAADVESWRKDRRTARAKGRAVPKLSKFADPSADFLVLLTRAGLGAVAGFVFHSQVNGAEAAVAVGAAAPALLAQLGRYIPVADAAKLEGTEAKSAASIPVADASSALPEEA
jgi:hypothetical protein